MARSLIHRLAGEEAALPVEGRLAPFDAATGWLGSEPLTPASLRGRVVLVDFWTYTCVNWLRTLPYVRAWAGKYRDAGLTVVGVHTPEFDFEHRLDNIVAALRRFDIEYPVAIDTEYGVWRAFANHYWPAVYIADVDGRIRYHHFGEGEYAMQEMVVQQLLLEAGRDVDLDLVSVTPTGLEVAADWATLRSPETYLGHDQATGLAAVGARFDLPQHYGEPGPLGLNQWSPIGAWTIASHASVSNAPGARIRFRFQARDVNLVMGPADATRPVRFRVHLDGAEAGASHGTDVDAGGRGTLDEQRTYQLVRRPGHVGEATFEIEFEEAGAEAYCFTFG